MAQIDSHCVVARTARELKAQVQRLVTKRVKRDPATFLGIEDLFGVEGPVRSGAMLGRSTYLELKSRASAKRLLSPNRLRPPNASWHSAQPVYFVEAKDGGYAVVAHLLVRSFNGVLRKARHLASSPKFIAALKRASPFEPLNDQLQLLGFKSIHGLAGDPSRQEPFEQLEKRYRSLAKLRRSLLPQRRIDQYFASGRS